MSGPADVSESIPAAPDPKADATRERAEAELADPGDPEASAPMPASALTDFAARGANRRMGFRESGHEVGGTARPQALTREIIALAWPVMGSQVLLNLTSLFDRMMIGRLAEAGSAAVPLAAVGYASQLFFLIHSTLIAVGLACVALMARAIGAGDPIRARQSFAAALQVSALLTLFYAGVIYFGSGPIFGLLGAEPAVQMIAIPYLNLTLVAALLLSVSLMIESAMRADRDARTPMNIAIVVTAVKLGLNALLIFGLGGLPRLELVGAGWATLISQAVGLGLFTAVLARTRRQAPTGIRIGDLFRVHATAREVVRISLPSVIERIVLNFGLLSYFWILSRWYGTVAVAAYTVGIAILSFSWIPGTGYAQACATLVGQALGATRPEEAYRTGTRSILLAVATAVPLGFLCAWLRIPLAELFTEDRVVVEALGPFMLTLAVAQPFLQLHFALGGVHRGAGDTMTPMLAAMVGNWAIRIPAAALVAGVFGWPVEWVWAALVLDHVSRSVYLGLSFKSGRWQRKRVESTSR